jgi:transcriptional regulator with XRE-family HTH domain
MKEPNIQWKIRKLREFREYSQEYMAIVLGISTKSYSRLENGRCDFTMSRLQKIAEILQVRIVDIFCLDESKLFNPDS